MSYQLAFSTLGCTEMPLPDILALATEFEIPAVELRGIEDEMHLPAILAKRYANPASLADYVASTGIKVASLDSSLNLLNANDESKAKLLEFVPWAEALGVTRIRVFDGGRYAPEVDEAELDRAARTADWWTALREKEGWGVDIMVETHDLLCGGSRCLDFLSRCDRPIPILWDSHHPWFKAGEAIETTWTALREHICHIHLRDSVVGDDDKYRSVLPGTGRYPFRELLDMLQRDNYRGVASLEWERKWEPELPPIQEALRALKAFF